MLEFLSVTELEGMVGFDCAWGMLDVGTGTTTDFEVEQANAMLVSTLALFVFDGRFVKLQITVMKQETALESIFSFILQFQKSINSES